MLKNVEMIHLKLKIKIIITSDWKLNYKHKLNSTDVTQLDNFINFPYYYFKLNYD